MREEELRLLLSAQRALLGAVPPSLRAVSVEYDSAAIRFCAIFDATPTEADRELLSAVATEIIADFSHEKLHEEYIVAPAPQKMNHLKHLVFLRHES